MLLSPRIYLTFKKNILGAKNCSLYTLLTYIGAVWKIGSKNLKKIKLFELQSIPRKNTICLKKELPTYLLANTNLIWNFKITTWLRTQNKQTINSFKHRTKQFGQKNRNVKKKRKMSRVWLIPMVCHAPIFLPQYWAAAKKDWAFFSWIVPFCTKQYKKVTINWKFTLVLHLFLPWFLRYL